MNEKNEFAMVPRTPGALEKAQPGAKRILAAMVAETLALVKREESKHPGARYRIGDCELCEPDYQQLMIWAKQLRLTPAETLRRLKQGLRAKGDEPTRVENGKFTALNWDAGLLHGSDFLISIVLELSELSFAPMDVIAEFCDGDLENFDGICAWDELPKEYDRNARVLRISSNALPKLKALCCACIGLRHLVMGPAPALERLICCTNGLERLDLGQVPELLELDCQCNLIKELDLHSVPKLRELNCSDNEMQELALANLPDLVELDCVNSSYDKEPLGRYLESLDLRGAPNLTRLNCSDNALEGLDLSCVPRLKDLNCEYNPLSALDVSCVPNLETLRCEPGYWSVWIKTLDIRPLLHLKELHSDQRTQLIQRPDQHFGP